MSPWNDGGRVPDPVAAARRRSFVVTLRDLGFSYVSISGRLGVSRNRARQIYQAEMRKKVRAKLEGWPAVCDDLEQIERTLWWASASRRGDVVPQTLRELADGNG